MNVERRGSVGQSASQPNCKQEEAVGEQTKPFQVSKLHVVEAYRRVRANAGAAGVDNQTLKDFEQDLKGNLYKIWNRLSSGSWMPPPVRAVEIPKKDGSKRLLGIPTVSDRIAQMTVLITFELLVERHFLNDSYGYRHGKSALDAIAVTRKRCWKYDWCPEFDIKGLFDNIPHDLLLRAVDKHCADKVAQKAMRFKIRKLKVRTRTDLNIKEIAVWLNPMINGWLNYYGKYCRSEMDKVFKAFNKTLVRWARSKYKALRRHKTRAAEYIRRMAKEMPWLFAHWKVGVTDSFG
ncbi:reverse transcriptase [Salmonella enterica subsp. enterica serovar Claibornei]|nr:reverse transcriptase [Salmonella enterica subsp. enterica serovar Claibornei]